MSKFTPGPWEASLLIDGCDQTCIDTIEFAFVGDLDSDTMCPVEYTQEEIHANARLISAAPDMYEALNDLLDCISETRGSDAHNAQLAAIAALAKADGK